MSAPAPDAAALARAVEQGELRVHYQPAIGLSDGTMRGVEALVRWEHPERGLVPPGEFIPAAEAGGLIGAIGAWVLEQAVRQVGRWNQVVKPPLVASVNVSGRQLADRRLIRDLLRILDETGAAPEHVCLEITESVLGRAGDGLFDVLRELRGMGVSLAVDDFGGGKAPLRLLAKAPVDEVKLEPGLVQALSEGEQGEAVLAGAVELAHRMGLSVTAKGVETEAQRDTLTALGCDRAQGFFLARPDDAGALQRLLQ
jgi:EAL domain-containing protein (putative c-di-GMP-specific phosphodiesterase class I)